MGTRLYLRLLRQSDGAAFTDPEEALAGTDAARADSIFTLLPTTSGAMKWNGKAGCSYTVSESPELDPADWNVATNIGALATDQLIELSLPTSFFYRVEVQYP
ncbi:hypothetical protein [Pontiella sulfatireligans]|uniref:Uncharacterized protein n=1 Tax=Pontiella sulfatireligans TaxID=2750658 RepID=A0A6C2UH35_9BACT|nr:hypothetical protein [Pontiella sulfatireligans]VGO19522.1 hypothetical protein SCARR_01581 [Pontiella sulfatireligans]